jgi:hypothetical protein
MTERKYSVTRRGLLVIVRLLEHFLEYLYGQEFHMHTNHSALTRLMNFKTLEEQAFRWNQRLQEHKFRAQPKPEAQQCLCSFPMIMQRKVQTLSKSRGVDRSKAGVNYCGRSCIRI